MIQFLSISDYAFDDPARGRSKLGVHIEMVVLGDSYCMLRLCRLAATHFMAELKECKDLDAFVRIVPLVYERARGDGHAVTEFAATDPGPAGL